MTNKKSLMLLVFLFFSMLMLTPPASAQIIENGNSYYYQQSNNYNSQFWQKEYESYFYPGLGHKEYEVLYQNGYRTNTTRYTGLYVFLPNESVMNQYGVTTIIEYKSGYDSYFTPNKGHKQYIEKWVNGTKTNDIPVYTGNYIILPNETIDSIYREPCSNNSDLYLNTTNIPLTKGLSGCNIYYLETGNKTTTIHAEVPYGYSLIVAGVTVDNTNGGVYKTFSTGNRTVKIKNGFAIIISNDDLYNEFQARVKIARNNNWKCSHITWPNQY
ncbi:MAG: hypothetical protein PHP97_02190 [Candidatus Shapirobacteria bacterium]|nr:hypothetical protein [Candidatus Shapirobacteria bacterium]MDD3002588.1 hypothetical protein [Candidatus Shapirobacteria bacterium]MDD4382785.1 hypothetical protein [Candidatus Shapirobacteria bacterium]